MVGRLFGGWSAAEMRVLIRVVVCRCWERDMSICVDEVRPGVEAMVTVWFRFACLIGILRSVAVILGGWSLALVSGRDDAY
jgi:hypothetical protein